MTQHTKTSVRDSIVVLLRAYLLCFFLRIDVVAFVWGESATFKDCTARLISQRRFGVLMSDEGTRAAIMNCLHPALRSFFDNSFGRAKDAA